MKSVCWGRICFLLVVLFGNPSLQCLHAQGPVEQEATAVEFQQWVKDLGDQDYSKRQLATIQLSNRKVVAIPYVIDALETATGEQMERLLQFLATIASDPYSEDGKVAFQAITDMARARTTSKASHAQKIIRVISIALRDESASKIATLGISVRDRDFQVITTKSRIQNALVIDHHFTGEAQELECLKWMSGVEFARLEGAGINREILKQVLTLPDLKRLQLVETILSADDLSVLKEAPDLDLLEFVYSPIGDEAVELLHQIPVYGDLNLFGTKISQTGQTLLKSKATADVFISRGGFLGVECQTTSVLINNVIPGGAADKASLRQGDRLLSINGKSMQVFDDLRRELAKYSDGETVTVEFERPILEIDRDEPRKMKYRKEKMQTQVTLERRREQSYSR